MHSHGPAPKPCPPWDGARRAEIEDLLAHPLPERLVTVYTSLGNGGFGPGYGLMGLGETGFCDDQGYTADRLYLSFREIRSHPSNFRWPPGVLPICHFGCAIYHCIDLNSDKILIWEPSLWDEKQSMTSALFQTGHSLADWFTYWADGGSPGDWWDKASTNPMGVEIEKSRKIRPKDPRQRDLFS